MLRVAFNVLIGLRSVEGHGKSVHNCKGIVSSLWCIRQSYCRILFDRQVVVDRPDRQSLVTASRRATTMWWVIEWMGRGLPVMEEEYRSEEHANGLERQLTERLLLLLLVVVKGKTEKESMGFHYVIVTCSVLATLGGALSYTTVVACTLQAYSYLLLKWTKCTKNYVLSSWQINVQIYR